VARALGDLEDEAAALGDDAAEVFDVVLERLPGALGV
jgi:hypothetical protein